MNNELKATLAGLSPAFITWLEGLRDRTNLTGTDNFKNTNATYVNIGKNYIVDCILAARESALHPSEPRQLDINGGAIYTGNITKE